MTEMDRIADQLTMAFEGDTWSGRPVRDIVATFTPASAAETRAPGGKSAWEILGHIHIWVRMARVRLGGQAATPTEAEDFPAVTDRSAAAWRALWSGGETQYRELADAIPRAPADPLE